MTQEQKPKAEKGTIPPSSAPPLTPRRENPQRHQPHGEEVPTNHTRLPVPPWRGEKTDVTRKIKLPNCESYAARRGAPGSNGPARVKGLAGVRDWLPGLEMSRTTLSSKRCEGK